MTRVAAAGAAVMGVAVLGVRAPGHADAAVGVVFGGLSTQKGPVIVEVDARRA